MNIKKVFGKSVKDSRGEKTIQVIVVSSKGKFATSAPAGKSRGKFEVKSYAKNLEGDINFINGLDADKINKIINKYISSNNLNNRENKKSASLSRPARKVYDSININSIFKILKDVEKMIGGRLGANSLFALEASLLKALAKEKGKELWQLLGGRKKKIRPVGNAIGGGLHSKGIRGKKPDFQEFLFIGNGKNFSESVKINKIAYNLAGKFLKSKKRNDEGAWETGLGNEGVLMVLSNVKSMLRKKGFKVDIGIDVAASSFFNKKYNYKNPPRKISRDEQVNYLKNLIEEFDIFYIEDSFNENDFLGFRELKKKCRDCLIVGDDLTVTNPIKLKKAIKNKSINAVIVKPNQIGSLISVKEVVNIAKKNKIVTIISHRSGETVDSTIADLGIGFGCDFIKTGIYGKVRESKLKRLVGIEKN